MMFWFKKKKIILDCFSKDNTSYEYAKIEKACNFYPDWWKNTPKEIDNGFHKSSTIKRCAGIIENYQHGVILPLWSDVNIKIQANQVEWKSAGHDFDIQFHDNAQWKTYADPKSNIHIKFVSPWHIKCKENIPFIFMQPYWNYTPFIPFAISMGIVNYKYQHGTHVNMFLNLRENVLLELKHRTPLAHIIPMSDREIEIRSYLISEKEWYEQEPYIKFTNNYKEIKNIKQQNERKCPFH